MLSANHLVTSFSALDSHGDVTMENALVASPKDISMFSWPTNVAAVQSPLVATSSANRPGSVLRTSAPNSASLPPSPVPSPGPSRALSNAIAPGRASASPSKLTAHPVPQRTSPFTYGHPAAAAYHQYHTGSNPQFMPPFDPSQHALDVTSLRHENDFCRRYEEMEEEQYAKQHTSRMSRQKRGLEQAPSNAQLLHTLTHLDAATRFHLLSAWIEQSATQSKDLQVLSHLIRPKLRTDMISCLPYELAFQILSYLPTEALLQAACVSKNWNMRCQDDLLWRRLCHQEKVNYSIPSSLPFQLDQVEPKQVMPAQPVTSRQFYRRHYITQRNWEKNPPLLHSFLSPATGVITSMQFNEDIIVAGLDVKGVGTIHVFGTQSGKWLRTLTGHEGGVWCLQFKGNMLVSGGCDRDIRVWDLTTGVCRMRLSGHTSTVRCLQLLALPNRPNCAISGSRDGTQRVWDLDSGECVHVLRGHSASVRCVAVNGTLAVSGSYDGTARVWDTETGECKLFLNGHTAQVYSVVFNDKYICTGALDTTVHVWHPTTGECIAVLQGHDALVGHLQLEDDVLVTGGSDGRICMWHLPTLSCQHKLHAHPTAVTTLHYDPQTKRLVTGGDDGVKIWNGDTGQLSRVVTEQVSSVWRVGSDHRRLVSAIQRGEGTIVEVMDFGVDL